MIHLKKGQQVLGKPQYIVYEGGDYNETDLVQVCDSNNPNSPIYSYQAFFIQNGYDYLSEPVYNLSFKIGFDDPTIIDYNILGFHKKRTIVKGELISIEYYRNFDGDLYSDLLIKETRTYIRNEIGIVIYRDTLVEWYLTDNNVGATKFWRKYYSPEEAINEGISRRKNMISLAKTILLRELNLLVGTPNNQIYAFDLLTTLSTQIKYFEEGYTQPLRDAINSSTKPYLNSNIKSILIEELTF
jgi:hypothetical protein